MDTPERRYDLDWLRIIAFALLILYHVGMYYVTWDWHVKSPQASAAIEPLMLLTAPWRLSLLFLVSGFATASMLRGRGAAGFLGRRSWRLLVPLLFGMLVIVPPQPFLEVVEKVQYPGSYLEFLRLYLSGYHGFCRGTDCLRLPTWNHLWFVAYLWVYTLALYALTRLPAVLRGRLRAAFDRSLAGNGILIAPLVGLVLIRLALVGAFPATHALVDDWYNHALYFGVFLLGYGLHGSDGPWRVIERWRWPAFGLAILGWAFLCAYFAGVSDQAPPSEALRNLQRSVFGAEQWLAIVAALGFARRHLAFDGPMRRYLVAAVFPVYILHQTIIVIVAHALKPAQLAAGPEALLLILVAFAGSFLGYEGVRRVPLLRPLFGLAAEPRPAPVFAARPPVRTQQDCA